MKLVASLVIAVLMLAAQTESGRTGQTTVKAVRHWTLAEVTRVAVEVSGEFQFRSDRLANPDRVYFDILNCRPNIAGRRSFTEVVESKLVTRVRVAETAPGITRVVLDLANGAEVNTSTLSNPNRLMVEVKMGAVPSPATVATETAATVPAIDRKPPLPAPTPEKPAIIPPVEKASAPSGVKPAVEKPSTPPVEKASIAPAPKSPASAVPPIEKPSMPPVEKASIAPAPKSPAAAVPPVEKPGSPVVEKSSAQDLAPVLDAVKAAKHTSSGTTSLVRALGLKMGRVVIDPGHGGHDQGTEGPKGLLEKELVLDVSMRLGKLLEDKLGLEVVYTRTDDTFIPLEGRTAIANDKRADLFLSIHANSSPLAQTTGVETYYLNFTDMRDSLDVAARENAGSEKSVFELQDVIQRITLHDKAAESKEFASNVQTALFQFAQRNNPQARNRGVRKAPFVVLIGAHMPSILAEIGFISNPKEEALLKKPEQRQKLAEALFRGVQKYAESLSHFQMARAQE
jgi:N-acetylmuramoyl-L-alanine amidase